MELIYPSKNQIMEFFKTHNGFIKVARISELMVASDHNNVQASEIDHIKSFLHELKSAGFLLVENEGHDIHNEGFSSTPDRISRYFARGTVSDVNDLSVKTEEELKAIVRTNENAHIPGSLHNKALIELELRHQSNIEDILRVRGTSPQIERAPTVKKRFKNKDVYVESRHQGGDQHILMGKRDGTPDKSHLIVDKENGSIRLEDGREEPTEIAPSIETLLTFPDGKKIRTTRELIEEVSLLPRIEIEKVRFNAINTTQEKLAESFMVTIPILIKNLSSNKVLIRDIKQNLEVPVGYDRRLTFTDLNYPDGFNLGPRDFLAFKSTYLVSIAGRQLGVNDQNDVYVQNKEKILSSLNSARVLFKFGTEVVTLEGNTTIEEISDLTSALIPLIKT